MKYLLIGLFLYLILILIFAISFNVNGAQYLILLGSGLKDNKETFVMIRRVSRALLYLNQNPECRVIVSGGVTGNSKVSEASVMKRLLMERNISEDRIIVEDKSTDTKENMLFSKEKLNPEADIVVCSSDYHVFRAKLLAIKYGYKCKSIFSQSTIFELIKHLPIEAVLIIRDMLKKVRS